MAGGGGGSGGGAAATTPDHNPSPSCCGGGGDHHNNNNKVYKGVRKRKWGKWVSEIRLPNSRERIWLGSYDSPEKAARAFDAALYCLRGCRANFNFPDTPFNLDDINAADRTLTAQQIQLIAARFANKQEEQPSSQQDHHHHHHGAVGANSNNNSSPESGSVMRENTTYTATTASSSISTAMHECDGRVVQVDHGDNIGEMDWTFLNELGDSSTVIGSHHYDGLYSDDLDKMHSGELLMYSTTTPFEEDNVGEIEGDDPFSNQPFLWNW